MTSMSLNFATQHDAKWAFTHTAALCFLLLRLFSKICAFSSPPAITRKNSRQYLRRYRNYIECNEKQNRIQDINLINLSHFIDELALTIQRTYNAVNKIMAIHQTAPDCGRK